MKISQLRKVLDAVAVIHQQAGRSDTAEGLRKLATALRSADKQTVAKTVEELSK